MTLIVKELVVKGIVSTSETEGDSVTINRDELFRILDEMKESITADCLERLTNELADRSIR